MFSTLNAQLPQNVFTFNSLFIIQRFFYESKHKTHDHDFLAIC